MRKSVVLFVALLIAGCTCNKLANVIEIASAARAQTVIDIGKAREAVAVVCDGSASSACEKARHWLEEVWSRLAEADQVLCGAKIAAQICSDPPELGACTGRRDLESEPGNLLWRARELEGRVFGPQRRAGSGE